MLVSAYGEALERIASDLGLEPLRAWLGRLLSQAPPFGFTETNRSEFEALIFRAREQIALLGTEETYRAILSDFGLDVALTPQTITTLTTFVRTKGSSSEIVNDATARGAFQALLGKAEGLLAASASLRRVVLAGRSDVRLASDEQVLEFVVYDFDEAGYSVGQLAKILIDLTELIDLVGIIKDPEAGQTHRARPRVAYAETGSDLLLAVITLASAAVAVKVICNAYYRVFFELPAKARVGDARALQEEMTALSMIQAAVDAGTLAPDTGVIYRERIDAHVRRLTRSGTLLREFKAWAAGGVRELLGEKREPPLLEAANPRDERDPDERGGQG